MHTCEYVQIEWILSTSTFKRKNLPDIRERLLSYSYCLEWVSTRIPPSMLPSTDNLSVILENKSKIPVKQEL